MQTKISQLSPEYEKEERELEEELRILNERSKESMRAYKSVQEQANKVNSQLVSLVESFHRPS